MTSRITELRKSGHTQEAIDAANAALQNDPTNKYVLGDLCWVHYDLCKKYVDQADANGFRNHFEAIVGTNVLPDNDMLNDKLCYLISNLIWAKNKDLDASRKQALASFTLRMILKLRRPSEAKALASLRNSFRFLVGASPIFLDFMTWAGWDTFTSEEFAPQTLSNGFTDKMSNAEKCVKSAAEALAQNAGRAVVDAHLPQMMAIAEQHPEFSFGTYRLGLLAKAMGNATPETAHVLIPFVRQKKDDFWAWKCLADFYPRCDDRRLACLLRATHCSVGVEWVLGALKATVRELLARGDYASARGALVHAADDLVKAGKDLDREMLAWMSEPWYAMSADIAEPDMDYIALTDSLIYADIPEIYGVVAYVNEEKHWGNVTIGTEKSVDIAMGKRGKPFPKVGDALMLRILNINENGRASVAEVKPAELRDTDFSKRVEGVVTANRNGSAHFVKSADGLFAYLPEKMFSESGAEVGCRVSAHIVRSFNKKRNEWGWGCASVETKND